MQKLFNAQLKPLIAKIPINPLTKQPVKVHWHGIAGIPVTLGAIKKKLANYKQDKLQNATLSFRFIEKATQQLLSLDANRLQDVKGINPLRSDLMPMGSLILTETMKFFDAKTIQVSTYGLRMGVLNQLAAAHTNTKPQKN